MQDILHSKPILKFPLDWHARLIVQAGSTPTRQEIEQVFSGLGLALQNLTSGQTSASGSYCSWQISARIPDLITFRAVSKALSHLPGVKMLL